MGKTSRLGNALYEGDVSIDFVGRKWLWYAISAVILALAVGGLLLQGPELRHRVRGRRRVRRQPARRPGHPGERRRDPQGRRRHRHRRGLVADREHLGDRLDPGPDRGADQRPGRPRSADVIAETVGVDAKNDISTQEVGASWGAQVAERALIGLVRLPGPRGAVHLGLLPRVEDVRRRHRGAGPRRRDHHRRSTRSPASRSPRRRSPAS